MKIKIHLGKRDIGTKATVTDRVFFRLRVREFVCAKASPIAGGGWFDTTTGEPAPIDLEYKLNDFAQGAAVLATMNNKEKYPMKRSIIVYGPQGCGKTTSAGKIMRAYGLRVSMDLDNAPPGPLHEEGVLYLTHDDRPSARGQAIARVPYDKAMQKVEGKS